MTKLMSQTSAIALCPGFHPADLTTEFRNALGWDDCLLPPNHLPPPDALGIFRYLATAAGERPLIFVGFSAGAVGAAGAAWLWQQSGRKVLALIAIDGWGLPLPKANFPIHRFSHDRFTHYSSCFGEPFREGFYCDPSVPHLELWRSPVTAHGWHVLQPGWRVRTTALIALNDLIERSLDNP